VFVADEECEPNAGENEGEDETSENLLRLDLPSSSPSLVQVARPAPQLLPEVLHGGGDDGVPEAGVGAVGLATPRHVEGRGTVAVSSISRIYPD